MSRRQTRGQVLIITAFAMIVLLGIGALVVDLGFSWMLRRQEQNAADPAAIAAARHLKDEFGDAAWNQDAAEADACFYAQDNGFFSDDPNCANALHVTDDLQVHSPPVSGPYSGTPGHVQVIVRETHPSFFGRIFGQSEGVVVTGAVAANTTGNSNSSSLVALQTDCAAGSAGDVDGGGEIRIFPSGTATDGGYVHVNSPCGTSQDDICDNAVGAAALSISGTLRAPFVNVTGTCTEQGSTPGLNCDPAPEPPATTCVDEGAVPLGDPLYDLPEPILEDFDNGVCPSGEESTPTSTAGCELKKSSYCPPDPLDSSVDICTLTPGVYYGGWKIGSKVRVFLEPGMYILAGGGISLSGTDSSVEAVSSDENVAARITIFSTDGPGCPAIGAQCQGAITFTAQQAFLAKALDAATCILGTPQACPWKGILLWQDATASNGDAAVKLGGEASTILSGTIYAPAAEVQIAGGTDTTGCSGPVADQSCLAIQIISWRWKISGNGLVEMPYDPSQLYQLDHRGLVH